MSYKMGIGNVIDQSAVIDDHVELGNYNYIGKNVVISGFKGLQTSIKIGDCNFIHDNTRIMIGPGGLTIGDWNVFHNSILMLGEKQMSIGHNCWFGQNTIIDSSGGLKIGNGVRVGMYSQIWTHVGSGELIEGCTLFGQRQTIIEDEVWLVGSCIVASGLVLGKRSVCLIGSNLTKNTEPNKVYGGNPAKHLEKLSFYKEVTLQEKFEMMWTWIQEYAHQNSGVGMEKNMNRLILYSTDNDEKLIFGINDDPNLYDQPGTSYFDLETKKYTKKLTGLERNFYRFIFDHKARFVPAE